ncbi:hypothetical protein EVAR_100671_1 [Eumeta japonica]|uniref:Uncharacterized protein n=1 Tax=Eumeta variegata TaxID=151549 RepID=A0A4C2A4M6_EUMVA|nr:hypothetical protein EVAR_100671_1 [Eumeta japonica]
MCRSAGGALGVITRGEPTPRPGPRRVDEPEPGERYVKLFLKECKDTEMCRLCRPAAPAPPAPPGHDSCVNAVCDQNKYFESHASVSSKIDVTHTKQ